MPSTFQSGLNKFKNSATNLTTKLLDDDFNCRMPMDHCWLCSVRVAASVISVYIMVAYIIAFLMELWWFWDTGGQLPYLAYILITGYFVTFILAAILVAGISNKKMPHLVLWLFGTAAILIPESGLVLYMSLYFWKIFTIYGLTEMTCWVCRLIVNVAGLICVYSLYSNWKEERQVLTSLRDLNRATPISGLENGRRMSVTSIKSAVQSNRVAYSNQAFNNQTELPGIPQPTPVLRRSMSVASLPPMLRPVPAPPPEPFCNEFNASLFDTRLRTSIRSRSMLDLSEIGRLKSPTQHQQEPQQQQQYPQTPVPQPRPYYTRSLDRSLRRYRSLGFFPAVGNDRMSCGYFSVPMAGFLLDPHGNVVYVHDPNAGIIGGGSRTSLGSDDMHKYRDVAL